MTIETAMIAYANGSDEASRYGGLEPQGPAIICGGAAAESRIVEEALQRVYIAAFDRASCYDFAPISTASAGPNERHCWWMTPPPSIQQRRFPLRS